MTHEDRGIHWPRENFPSKDRLIELPPLALASTIQLTQGRARAIQAGGHVGLWPLELSKHFAEVYTFEPHPDLFLCLVRNVPSNVIPINAVLGRTPGTAPFLARGGTGGVSCVSPAVTKDTINVARVVVDDLALDACDLIVLDIEGSELEALLGAKNTIEKFSPVLHLEVWNSMEKNKLGRTEDLFALLDLWGYRQVGETGKDRIYVR
jgi:FkbM family methyltransferase